MNIYIAAPLFNDSEKKRNIEIQDILKTLGYETFLPQVDGGIAFDILKKDEGISKVRKQVFENDVAAIKRCDIIFCILDGRVPDEGLCIELGIAYALGKRCIGYKTDQRSLDKYGDNLIIEGCLEKILYSEGDIKEYLKMK
jgi:nucleoside 2-deoxyribosyltransferase